MEIFWILSLAGFSVSLLSALESRVKWIASFCALFGEGCLRTEDFTLFRIPVSWWGIGFYTILAFLFYYATPWAFWLVMVGLGIELTFLRLMISMRVFCIFCLFNAIVVTAMVWVLFDPDKIWQAASLALFFFMSSNYFISRENASRISQGQTEEPETVVAKVNGETITREALERPLLQRIYKLENKIYKLKRQRLEKMLQHILLEKEAKGRGISKERLLDNILSGDHGASDQKKKEIIGNYANRLKEKYEVDIFLPKPSLPLTQVEIEGSPVRGPADAPVVVVEFSDPLCPACRAAYKTTCKIREAYPDQIRWVFKDFPLETHKGAKKAAEAAHCAEEQGRFWEYHDMLIKAEEENPDAAKLKEYAQKLGLDKEAFDRCLNKGKYRSQIENDIQAGKSAGISAVPTFIVNGKMISGALSFEEFREKIDAELKAAAQVTNTSASN